MKQWSLFISKLNVIQLTFNITVIPVYAPNINAEQAEVEQF